MVVGKPGDVRKARKLSWGLCHVELVLVTLRSLEASMGIDIQLNRSLKPEKKDMTPWVDLSQVPKECWLLSYS